MAQTTVQNERSIRLGSAKLLVDGVDIGALQNAKLEVKMEVFQLKPDNAELTPRKKISSAKISCDAWEITIDNLQKFSGVGQVTSTTATAQNVTGEILAHTGTTVAKGEIFQLKNANADGSVVTAVTLKNGANTIPAAQYTLGVRDGRAFIVYTGAALTLADNLVIDYTYTPAAKKTYTMRDVITLIETHRIELINTDEHGKKFIVEFPRAYNVSGIDMAFQADDKLDDVMKTPLEFQAMATPNKELCYIHDEQAG